VTAISHRKTPRDTDEVSSLGALGGGAIMLALNTSQEKVPLSDMSDNICSVVQRCR
jgi:hypothetical protein